MIFDKSYIFCNQSQIPNPKSTQFPLVQELEKGYTPSPEIEILFTKFVNLVLISAS